MKPTHVAPPPWAIVRNPDPVNRDGPIFSSQSTMTDSSQIVYEHPLNEKTRTLLRLEHLFQEANHFLGQTDAWGSRGAVDAIIGLATVFSRSDLKGELLKEMERHRANLARLSRLKGVDTKLLREVMDRLSSVWDALQAIEGQIGLELRENEFLKNVIQRTAIAGGSCAFDLPLYHYWLAQAPEVRIAQLGGWLNTLEAAQRAVALSLEMIRGSALPQPELATTGFFQRGLDAAVPVQMIRVGIPSGVPYYPEVSGGKHRFSVRFLVADFRERPAQVKEDVNFGLTLCAF